MSNHIELNVDADKELFFCTDIHGHIGHLKNALSQLGFRVGTDVCVAAGDLIDRGPESLKTAAHFCNGAPSFYSVLGNHDDFSVKDDRGNWLINGGKWAFDGLDEDGRACLAAMLGRLPYLITVKHRGKTFGVVHGGVPYACENWEELVAKISDPRMQLCVTWDREFVEYAESDYYQQRYVSGVDFVISGHTPVARPITVANRLFMDTGIAYGKCLTVTHVVDGVFRCYMFKPDGEKLNMVRSIDFCVTTGENLMTRVHIDAKTHNPIDC